MDLPKAAIEIPKMTEEEHNALITKAILTKEYFRGYDRGYTEALERVIAFAHNANQR